MQQFILFCYGICLTKSRLLILKARKKKLAAKTLFYLTEDSNQHTNYLCFNEIVPRSSTTQVSGFGVYNGKLRNER